MDESALMHAEKSVLRKFLSVSYTKKYQENFPI